jgi:hypothetical protein
MPRPILAAVLLHGAVVSTAGAQTRPPSMAAPSTDSAAWQRVLVHVVSSLSSQLVRAAADPAPQPWRIELPADEPQRALLEAQLRRIVRTRPPTGANTVVYELALGPLRVVGDTARVPFRTSVTRRCPGSTQTTGWGNGEEILVPRAPAGFWGAARSTQVVHGDRVGCVSRR